MLRIVCLLTFVVVLTGTLQTVSPAAVQTRARPGSFVYYNAPSVDSLVSQITGNPVVGKRYATHFGVSVETIAKYCRENLKTITLSRPATVTTYFISKHGTIQSKRRTLPTGALVFANQEGELIMEARCGNPLTKRLPASKPVAKVKASPVETVGEPPVEEPTVIPPPVSAIPEPVEVAEPVVAMAISTEPIVAPAVEAFSPSFMNFAEIALPALIAAVAVRTDKDTPPYIPEPSPCAATALASLAVAAGWWKHRPRASRR